MAAQFSTADAPARTPSAVANILNDGCFGLSGARLGINPDAPLDVLAFDALCLVQNSLAVFEGISDSSEMHDMHFAGLYLLRQAAIVIDALQMTLAQGKAAGGLAV